MLVQVLFAACLRFAVAEMQFLEATGDSSMVQQVERPPHLHAFL